MDTEFTGIRNILIVASVIFLITLAIMVAGISATFVYADDFLHHTYNDSVAAPTLETQVSGVVKK